MLKTNSKQARENVKAYIINNFVFEPYGEKVEEPKTFKEISIYIMDAFRIEKVKYDKRKMNIPDLFEEWCQGLPSVLDTCYYYNRSAVEDLGDILEETQEERSKYTEQQAEERLTYLIYRELVKVVK